MLDIENGIVLLAEGQSEVVVIDYTNHRGERAKRRVGPMTLFWGATEWHPEPGLMLSAYDIEKRVYRDFAVRDIHGVEQAC